MTNDDKVWIIKYVLCDNTRFNGTACSNDWQLIRKYRHTVYIELLEFIQSYFNNICIHSAKIRQQVFYHYFYNIRSIPLCKKCNISDRKFYGFFSGYTKYCSTKCAHECSEYQLNRKKLSISRYGVENPMQLKEIQDKIKKTNLEKYGVYSATKLQYIQLKRRHTCLEKYGVDNPLKNENIRNKIKNACLEKYGVDNPLKNENIRNKIKNTCLIKYRYTLYISKHRNKK